MEGRQTIVPTFKAGNCSMFLKQDDPGRCIYFWDDRIRKSGFEQLNLLFSGGLCFV